MTNLLNVLSSGRGRHALRVTALFLAVPFRPAVGQVAVAPATITPAAFERLALRVANPEPSPVVRVRLEVPGALALLGVDAPPGWRWRLEPPTDTTATAVVWWGDSLSQGTFHEFPIFARLQADARQLTLVFPVRLDHADGRTVTLDRGGAGLPPTVDIRGTTAVSVRGAIALAGGALGVAVLALALTLHRRRA